MNETGGKNSKEQALKKEKKEGKVGLVGFDTLHVICRRVGVVDFYGRDVEGDIG